MKMTLDEYTNLTDTDKAFLKLEGRCVGCGCDMNMKFMNSPLIVHSEWCSYIPKLTFAYNWDRGTNKIVTNSSRQGKSVFADMATILNKTFRKQYENTNR